MDVPAPARCVSWPAIESSLLQPQKDSFLNRNEKRRPREGLFFCGEAGCVCVLKFSTHPPRPTRSNESYLVDPASSHMLVSKIKPCMSKYKQLYTVKLQMAH